MAVEETEGQIENRGLLIKQSAAERTEGRRVKRAIEGEEG
jgi:hypothetical protein